MPSDAQVIVRRGPAMAEWLDAVARLRIEVFRHYPYLYDGDVDYEAQYLAGYARSPDSLLVIVLADGDVVGASTGLPLARADTAFQVPFVERGMGLETVFYFGESVLLPAWRGQGFGHRFFDERESHARSLDGCRWTTFAAVDRAEDDPRRSLDYRDNTPFWTARGYRHQPDMRARLPWKEIGQQDETEQTLTFWLRPLENA